MKKVNGDPPRWTPAEVLAAFLYILQELDGPRFRVVSKAPPETTDEQILEAMHRARLEHPGINRVLKQNSKRWLRENTDMVGD